MANATVTTTTGGRLPGSCPHCGMFHQGACSRIKAIDYYPDGTIKRVEYYDERAAINPLPGFWVPLGPMPSPPEPDEAKPVWRVPLADEGRFTCDTTGGGPMRAQPTREAAEACLAKAIADFKAIAGKVVYVANVCGYIGDTDNSDDFHFEPPIAVRMDPWSDALIRWALDHWNDEWLDPYWECEVVDPAHPEMPVEGLRSCWVPGTSYNGLTGEVQPTKYRLEGLKERVERWVRVRRWARRRRT